MTGTVTWAADRQSAGLRRGHQVALGVVWLLDAALQFQPYMFHREFVTAIIEPAGQGSPAAVASSVTAAGHLMLASEPAFNAAFATVQLALGLGLLWRPTVRAALAGTAGWALAVWWFGEGAGGVLTGSASPLTGAARRRAAVRLPRVPALAGARRAVPGTLAAAVGKLRVFPAAGPGQRAGRTELRHLGAGRW